MKSRKNEESRALRRRFAHILQYASLGREWPSIKPEFVEARLSDGDIQYLGQLIYEVAKSQRVKGRLRFEVYENNREVLIYSKKRE